VQLSGRTAAAEISAARATSATVTLKTPYQMRSATTERRTERARASVGLSDCVSVGHITA
jgi:hypothetical protein